MFVSMIAASLSYIDELCFMELRHMFFFPVAGAQSPRQINILSPHRRKHV